MTNSHPPTALDRDPGSLCERCRCCAGCHAEIGGCPVPNTSCVIGREDCGMPAESHLDCNESGLVTHSRHSFRRYPAATGREPEDRYEPGVQRDIRAANRALGKAIMALLRIEKRLEGEDSDRFGHTLDAACMASNSLLIFADGGWGTDAGVVRLYASETDDGS